MKKFAILFLSLFALNAFAADLPSRKAAPIAPPPGRCLGPADADALLASDQPCGQAALARGRSGRGGRCRLAGRRAGRRGQGVIGQDLAHFPGALQVGLGAQFVSSSGNFSKGAVQQKGNQFDLAITGDGFFKIEMPDGVDFMPRHDPDFQNLHRNKRSITLNLKEPEGKAIFMKMVEKADVVVENYRADVKFRLGIDYENLKKVNPRIVLGSISGFGQDGPYAERAGFDQIAQGMGGLMWITGMPGGGPVRAGIAVADVGAGLHCAIGILIALYALFPVLLSVLAGKCSVLEMHAANLVEEGGEEKMIDYGMKMPMPPLASHSLMFVS